MFLLWFILHILCYIQYRHCHALLAGVIAGVFTLTSYLSLHFYADLGFERENDDHECKIVNSAVQEDMASRSISRLGR